MNRTKEKAIKAAKKIDFRKKGGHQMDSFK